MKVTVTPPTGLPPESLTVASRAAKAVLICTLCGVPPVAVTEAGVGALVSEKVAELAPVTEAVTVKDPVVPFAVSVGAVATPLELVVAVAVAPPGNDPLAPAGLTVKVTVTPPTGLPPA